jgi:hypothetical protein
MASLKILIEMRNLQVIYEREIIIVSFVSNDILDHINKVGKKLNMMCKRSPPVRPPDFELADLDIRKTKPTRKHPIICICAWDHRSACTGGTSMAEMPSRGSVKASKTDENNKRVSSDENTRISVPGSGGGTRFIFPKKFVHSAQRAKPTVVE